MNDPKAKRMTYAYTHEVAAPPDKIFPLLCPVREYDWIDGWACNMVYSDSGLAEDNCVFTSSFARGVEEMYVVSEYDPNRRIQFVTFSPQHHVMKFDISLEDHGDSTTIKLTQTMTGLSDKGNSFVQHYADNVVAAGMKRLVTALEHYVRTGQMLKRAR